MKPHASWYKWITYRSQEGIGFRKSAFLSWPGVFWFCRADSFFLKLFQSDNEHTCRQNDRLNGGAIYFTLEYPISLPVEDNKVSLSICETLYKCSKLTIQNCHGGNPIWRYVSNLICYITFLLLFHSQEFHWWTL